MISAVDFVSLEVFKGLNLTSDMAVISIGDPATVPPSVPASISYHRAEFLDLTPDELKHYGMTRDCLPQPKDLAGIIQFISHLHSAEKGYRVVVHCRMGISRSAAIALLTHCYSGCHFPRKVEAYDANEYVLMLGGELLNKRIYRPEPPLPSAGWFSKPGTLLI